MLRPDELTVGSFEAAQPLTLAFPRKAYEHLTLIFEDQGKTLGLFLAGNPESLFRIFECKNNSGLVGPMVAGVRIEFDPTSMHDLDQDFAPLGSLIRHSDKLAVQTSYVGNRMSFQNGPMTLVSGLPACEADQRACFLKWQIVLGDGIDKRVLHTNDATPTKN